MIPGGKPGRNGVECARGDKKEVKQNVCPGQETQEPEGQERQGEERRDAIRQEDPNAEKEGR